MKTKTSKKVLSLILAVMMLVTSIPMLGFVALADEIAATDPAVVEVQDAMDAFEAKLSSAGAFTNVTAAYEAYVDCQEALDAYIYGGETDALTGKADALNTAVANIGDFTGYTIDSTTAINKTVWSGDSTNALNFTNDTDSRVAGYGYKNVLWVDAGYNPSFTDFTNYSNCDMTMVSGKSVTTALAYPSAVLFYDGVTTPQTSVMTVVQGNGQNVSNKDRYTYAVVSASDDFTLPRNWTSGFYDKGSFDHTWNMYNNTSTLSNSSSGFNGSSAVRIAYYHYIFPSGYKTERFTYPYANMLQFTGTVGTDEYIKTVYPSITSYSGSTSTYTTTDIVATVAGSRPIYIVNSTVLTAAMEANGNKMKAVDLAEYSEGGLAEYIAAMEALASFDFNSYFTSGNGYAECETAMRNAVTTANNASTTNTNSTAYADLRAAMSEAIRNTYAAGNTGYTSDSWSNFAVAYAKAQTIMAAVNETGYTSTDAETVAAELVAAYNALQTNVTRVDTTALVNAIDTFEAYNSGYFTADSYAAVQTVVAAAKAAVWGAEDDYKIPTSAPEDSAEAQALVAEQLALVQEAIKGLRLSPDAVVAIDSGDRYSLNTAYALAESVEDPTDYSNYVILSTAVNDAKTYEATLATTEFTDLTTQLATYTSYVNAIVDAYEGLKYSFTKIPNGTVFGVNTASVSTNRLDKDGASYEYWLNFSYPSEAVIFRTNRDAVTVPYGHANIEYSLNIDNNIGKENNALDSITINGTADANDQINGSGAGTSTPPALSDDQKATYAGGLTSDNFSLSNFVVSDTVNYGKSYYGITADGTQVTERTPANDEYTTILATTEGSGTFPATGVIANQPRSTGDSTIYLQSDMNYSLAATTGRTLSASTKPTRTTHTHTGYFGATLIWNTQPSFAYAGYAYLTSKSNNQQINSTVIVIDMTYLVELVDQSNAIMSESYKYTEDSWATFLAALQAAQEDMDYTNMTSTAIYDEVGARYDALWTAYSGLETKTFNVVFNWKNSTGADASRTITVKYGETLTTYNTQVSGITTPNYTDGVYTYTFSEWAPALDMNEAITADKTYNAVYASEALPADWDAFNAAKAALIAAVTPETYSASTLEALDASANAISFFNLTTEEQALILKDRQSEIDEQTAAITALTADLQSKAITIDTSAGDAIVDDIDRYDGAVSAFETVTSVGVTVIAYAYENQTEYDAAVNAALTVKDYTIYLNDATVATVAYGTEITVYSDGTYVVGAAGETTAPKASWYYSFAAPSRDNVQTADKYMSTDSFLTFIVKGTTYLTANSVEDETATGYLVKLVANLGGTATKTYAIAYTDASGVLVDTPATPTYAHYKFTGYTCADATLSMSGGNIVVDADCTVTANYEAISTVPTYVISYCDSFDDWNGGTYTSSETYSYNDLVTLVDNDGDAKYWFAAWISDVNLDLATINLDLLYIGSEYSFRACQSFDNANEMVDESNFGEYFMIVSFSEEEYLALLEANYDAGFNFPAFYDAQGNLLEITGDQYNKVYPVIDVSATDVMEEVIPVYDASNNLYKISMIGTYVLPEGYSMVESGILFTSDTTADLLIENVGTNGIARMKSSQHTEGDQFVISVLMGSADYQFKYASYVIVKDASGNMSTYYSNAYIGNTADYR